MRPRPALERGGIAIKKVDNLFPSHMKGFVIACVLKPFNLIQFPPKMDEN